MAACVEDKAMNERGSIIHFKPICQRFGPCGVGDEMTVLVTVTVLAYGVGEKMVLAAMEVLAAMDPATHTCRRSVTPC